MNLKDALYPLAIGAGIGVVLNMLMNKPAAAAMEATAAAEGLTAEDETDMTLGQKPASEGYNTSEVWDFRDRLDDNDNVLYNKLPFIDIKQTGEWDPENMRLIGSRDYDCVA